MPAGTRLVATAGGAVVGFAALVADEVHAVYVQADRVRRGIGSALLAPLEAAARAAGVRALRLSSSLTAVPFHLDAGYRRVGDATPTQHSGMRVRCVDVQKRPSD